MQKQIEKRLRIIEKALEVISNLPTVKEAINDKAKEAIDKYKEQEKMIEDMAKEHEKKEAEEAIKKEQKRIEEQGTKDLVSKEEKKEIDKLHDEEEGKDAYESEQRAKNTFVRGPKPDSKYPDIESLKKEKFKPPTQNYGMGVEAEIAGESEEPLIKPETKDTDKTYKAICNKCSKEFKSKLEPESNVKYLCHNCSYDLK